MVTSTWGLLGKLWHGSVRLYKNTVIAVRLRHDRLGTEKNLSRRNVMFLRRNEADLQRLLPFLAVKVGSRARAPRRVPERCFAYS